MRSSVDGLMAGHPEETPLPEEVVGLLGADIIDHAGAGTCRVISGGGLVAKVGPREVVAREAAVLASADLPLAVPALIDAGPGWLVMAAERDDESPWDGADLYAALSDLARLHDAFEGPVGDRVDRLPGRLRATLRQPFSPEGIEELLAPARRLGLSLPAPLTSLLRAPAPIVDAAAAAPPTLLHGDPWPRNILRPTPGRRVWVDWELASLGPAAADIASWLGQTPWLAGCAVDGHLETYLAARSRSIDQSSFQRAFDAATVLWFLAYDVPRLRGAVHSRRAGSQRTVAVPVAAAERLADGWR